MIKFNWNHEYDIGVGEMNGQHRILMAIMGDVYKLNEGGASKLDICRKLDELGCYTRKHFREEELYMDSIGFEGSEMHKIIHRQLLSELEKHIETFKNYRQSLSEDFFHFLRHWLTTHIKHIDIKYGIATNQLKLACAGGL